MSNVNYEAVVIFSLKNGDDVSALVEKFKALIEANGTLGSVEEWGKKKLAYAIDFETEGYYVLYNFESSPEFPAEFNRVVNITDGAMRSQVVKAVATKAVEAKAEETVEESAE